MIIELFGPPGAGKTTLARALSEHLRRNGRPLRLIRSRRPAEDRNGPMGHSSLYVTGMTALMRRASRPMVELCSLARHPADCRGDLVRAAMLLRLLPPMGHFQRIKRLQYLVRFFGQWRGAEDGAAIAVFDQGIIQAISSLALASGRCDEAILGRALDLAPRVDLVIHLEAPAACLSARIAQRASLQGPLERWLEFRPVQSNPDVTLYRTMRRLLLARGHRVVDASSIDEASVRDGLDLVDAALGLAATTESETYRDARP